MFVDLQWLEFYRIPAAKIKASSKSMKSLQIKRLFYFAKLVLVEDQICFSASVSNYDSFI